VTTLTALIAFSTGWYDRRARQRTYHYEEVKRVYSDALRIAGEVSVIHLLAIRSDQDELLKVVTANTSRIASTLGDIDLVGDYKTGQLLSKYVFQELMAGLTRTAAVRETGLLANPPVDNKIENVVVMQQVRRTLSRYVPFWSHHARLLRKPMPRDLAGALKVFEQQAERANDG